MSVRDRVRNQIARRLSTHNAPESAEDIADDILSIPELAVVDREAEFELLDFSDAKEDALPKSIQEYINACSWVANKQAYLLFKAGWVKECKE